MVTSKGSALTRRSGFLHCTVTLKPHQRCDLGIKSRRGGCPLHNGEPRCLSLRRGFPFSSVGFGQRPFPVDVAHKSRAQNSPCDRPIGLANVSNANANYSQTSAPVPARFWGFFFVGAPRLRSALLHALALTGSTLRLGLVERVPAK